LNFTASGTGAFIDASTPSDFNIGAGQFTLECWAYLTSGGDGPMLARWGTPQNHFYWGIAGGIYAFYWSTTGSDFPVINASSNPSQNAWHHLAVDRDASNVIRLYIDGTVVGSSTAAGTFIPSTLALRIGNDTAARSFKGRLTRSGHHGRGAIWRRLHPADSTIPFPPILSSPLFMASGTGSTKLLALR
jgi:hypothetical protein